MSRPGQNLSQQAKLKLALLAVLALPLALKPFTSQDQKASDLASEAARPGGAQPPAASSVEPAPAAAPIVRVAQAATGEAPVAENRRICGMVYRVLYTSRVEGADRKSLVYLQRSTPECSARLEYDADCTLKSVQRNGTVESVRGAGEAVRELEGLMRADLARMGVDCAARDREAAAAPPAPPSSSPSRPIVPARDAEADRRDAEALARDVRECVRDRSGERLREAARTDCLINRLSRLGDEDREICRSEDARRQRDCRPESDSQRRARIEREADRIYGLVISDLRRDLTARDLGQNETGRERAEALLDALKELRADISSTRLDRMEQRVSGLIVGATVRERSTDSIEELRERRREIAELSADARRGDTTALMRLQQVQQRALEEMLNARNSVADPVWSLQRNYLAAMQPEDRRVFLQPYTSLLGEMNGLRNSMQPWAQMQSTSLLASLPQMQMSGLGNDTGVLGGPGLIDRPGDLGAGRSRFISDFRSSLGAGPAGQGPGGWGNSWVNSTSARVWNPANTWQNPRQQSWGQQQPPGWGNPNAWGRSSTWNQQGWQPQQQPGWSPRAPVWGQQQPQGWGTWGSRL